MGLLIFIYLFIYLLSCRRGLAAGQYYRFDIEMLQKVRNYVSFFIFTLFRLIDIYNEIFIMSITKRLEFSLPQMNLVEKTIFFEYFLLIIFDHHYQFLLHCTLTSHKFEKIYPRPCTTI